MYIIFLNSFCKKLVWYLTKINESYHKTCFDSQAPSVPELVHQGIFLKEFSSSRAKLTLTVFRHFLQVCAKLRISLKFEFLAKLSKNESILRSISLSIIFFIVRIFLFFVRIGAMSSPKRWEMTFSWFFKTRKNVPRVPTVCLTLSNNLLKTSSSEIKFLFNRSSVSEPLIAFVYGWSQSQNWLPLRFKKAERVWCGGAPSTHWATCNNGVTPSKSKEFLESPCFFRSEWYMICTRYTELMIFVIVSTVSVIISAMDIFRVMLS